VIKAAVNPRVLRHLAGKAIPVGRRFTTVPGRGGVVVGLERGSDAEPDALVPGARRLTPTSIASNAPPASTIQSYRR
jgi:hypothetical protein